jgi:hypothetical protein
MLDRNGEVIKVGSPVFDTYCGDYGVVVSLFGNTVEVSYGEETDFASPEDLEVCA